jgi:hypothetical protein
VYRERYGNDIKTEVKPRENGDYFQGVSATNTLLGDFLTAYSFHTHESSNAFSTDSETSDNANAFGLYQNGEFVTQSGDVFNVTGFAVVDGQRGKKSVVTGDADKRSNIGDQIIDHSRNFFLDHFLTKQICSDLYSNNIGQNFRGNGDLGNSKVCTEPSFSFIPSHVLVDYIPFIPSKLNS